MEFESITHAIHYAKGSQIEIVVVHGDVLDITKFKHAHPGGEESINKYLFQDVSEMYDTVKSHKTKSAIRELVKFKIGSIKKDSNNKIIKDDIQEHDIPYTVDLQKGTCWQVFFNMNLKQYLAFVHDPKHMIDPPEAIIFDTPFLEFFTKTSWYMIPIIWVPFVLYLIHMAYVYDMLTIPQIIYSFFIGLIIWSLMEYFLHRFVFHIDENLPNNKIAIFLHYTLHGIHHAFPMDEHRLVFPPILATILIKLFYMLFRLLFDEFGAGFFAGTITGYICYDLTHYFLHHITPSSKYFKFLKKYHIMHHYKDPELGFGVSQHFWDWVFDTMILSEDTSEDKKI